MDEKKMISFAEEMISSMAKHEMNLQERFEVLIKYTEIMVAVSDMDLDYFCKKFRRNVLEIRASPEAAEIAESVAESVAEMKAQKDTQ